MVVESLERKQEVLILHRFVYGMFGADFQRSGPRSFRNSFVRSGFEKRNVVRRNCLSTDYKILCGNSFTGNPVWFDWFKLCRKERQSHHINCACINLKGNFAISYRNWSRPSLNSQIDSLDLYLGVFLFLESKETHGLLFTFHWLSLCHDILRYFYFLKECR